jgi:hypothetical protein
MCSSHFMTSCIMPPTGTSRLHSRCHISAIAVHSSLAYGPHLPDLALTFPNKAAVNPLSGDALRPASSSPAYRPSTSEAPIRGHPRLRVTEPGLNKSAPPRHGRQLVPGLAAVRGHLTPASVRARGFDKRDRRRGDRERSRANAMTHLLTERDGGGRGGARLGGSLPGQGDGRGGFSL